MPMGTKTSYQFTVSVHMAHNTVWHWVGCPIPLTQATGQG